MVRKVESNKDLQNLKEALKDPEYLEVCNAWQNARSFIQVDGRSNKDIEKDIIEFANSVKTNAIEKLEKYNDRPKLVKKLGNIVLAADSVIWQARSVIAGLRVAYKNDWAPYESGMLQEDYGMWKKMVEILVEESNE